MESVSKLKYAFVSRLGGGLSKVKVNTVRPVSVDQKPYYAKRRLLISDPLIVGGNLYLKLIGAHARVLPTNQWLRWESDVYRAVYDIDLPTDASGRLLIPEWPGVVLSRYVEPEVNDDAAKLSAIKLAAQSLFQLHGVNIQWPDGHNRPLSHGDATVENVIVDHAQMMASWFDFDTMHEITMDSDGRHADDLRALTYSAAARLHSSALPALAQTVVESYPSRGPLDALAELLVYTRAHPNSFHLAQAQVDYRKREVLDEALLRSLRARTGGLRARVGRLA
jgi:hypothetical protein